MSCERANLKLLLRVSLVIGFLVTSASANDKAEEQARPLLKAAAERSLLSGDVGSPYSLAATFSVRLSGTKRVDGKYVSLLTSEGDWAKQLLFADYSDLQVAHGSTVWLKRSVAFQPLQAAIVQNAFNSPLHLNEPGTVVDRYFKLSDHHVDLQCVDILRGRSRHTVCVDSGQNVRLLTIPTHITYEYSDFRPAGKKFVPYRIIAKQWEKTVLDVKVDKVALDSETVSQVPAPAEGSIQRTGCLSPILPTLKQTEAPDFPESEPYANSMRRLMIYALIGTDGRVKEAVVTQSGGRAFDVAVLEAVRHWQYEPARCGETPVEFEAEVSWSFRMVVDEEHFGWPQ